MAGEKTLLRVAKIDEGGVEAPLYIRNDTTVDVAALLIGFSALDVVELEDALLHDGHAKLLGVSPVDQHHAIAHICPLVM